MTNKGIAKIPLFDPVSSKMDCPLFGVPTVLKYQVRKEAEINEAIRQETSQLAEDVNSMEAEKSVLDNEISQIESQIMEKNQKLATLKNEIPAARQKVLDEIDAEAENVNRQVCYEVRLRFEASIQLTNQRAQIKAVRDEIERYQIETIVVKEYTLDLTSSVADGKLGKKSF